MNASSGARHRAPPAAVTRVPPLAADARQAPVLVVDDDALSCTLLLRMLALLGVPGREASPDEAVVAACEGQSQALLLDLGMPGQDGFAVLKRIRSDESKHGRRPLPIIAVTGYASDTDRLRCLSAGFNDHLSKPVDAGALNDVLQRQLRDTSEPAPGDNDATRVQATAARLARMKPADATFAPTMLETFAMRSGQLVEETEVALRQGDAAALLRAAQSLSASAEFMGASGLARMCNQLAELATQQQIEAAAAVQAQLASAHQAVLSVLLLTSRRTGW